MAAAGPHTIREFSFPVPPRSSRALHSALLFLSLALLYHSYHRLAAASFALLLVSFTSERNAIVQESLIAIKGIGVQLTKTTQKGSSRHVFLDSTQVKDVIINEVSLGRE